MLRTSMSPIKKPVPSPVSISEAKVEAPALVAEAQPVAPVVAEAPADPCEPLRLLLAQREAEVATATQALTTGFTVELLATLNASVGNLNTAKAALATKVAEINAAQFIPSMVEHLCSISGNVPHAVWGSQVRFEITFTSEGTPSVRRVVQPAPTYSPSGGKAVTRNRTASVGRDKRLPGVGWWFTDGRYVIRIADDSEQVVAWNIGGPPAMFSTISNACTKILGSSRNGYVTTNLGAAPSADFEGDSWNDSNPKKGWSSGEIPGHLKPATF